MKCTFCGLFRKYVLQPVCGQHLFNSDMSLELDRLLMVNERQQRRIHYLEGFLTTADDPGLTEAAQQCR